jgi:hypothetical protein
MGNATGFLLSLPGVMGIEAEFMTVLRDQGFEGDLFVSYRDVAYAVFKREPGFLMQEVYDARDRLIKSGLVTGRVEAFVFTLEEV